MNAFDLLRKCAAEGTPVVPLFGNGVSIASGVPTTSQIADHLVRTHRLLTLQDKHADHEQLEHLRTHGWMGRHAANAALHATLGKRSVSHAIDVSTQRLLARIGAGRAGGEWLAFLQHLTGSDPALIDSYFARLVYGRRPSTAHHFIGFLTKVFNWNPILTTNFDDLIESALRAQGLNPTVFELAIDHGNPNHLVAPHHRLVRADGRISVVKLHGGTHGLTAGPELNEDFPAEILGRYCEYIDRNAVLLVLGYGSNERRVLGLLSHLIRESAERRIIWVYRTERPADGALPGADNRFVKAETPALFLHELYQRLLFTHPAGIQPYVALHHTQSVDYAVLRRQPELAGLGFEAPQSHARRRLLRWYARESTARRNGTVAWFNLYEFPSLTTFLEALVEQLQSSDRELPVAARPCTSANLEDWTLRRYRDQIATALRRHRYSIALDAYRAFRNGIRGPGEQLHGFDRNEKEEKRFREFLGFLAMANLGESTISVVMDEADKNWRTALHARNVHVIPTSPPRERSREYERGLRAGCLAIAQREAHGPLLLQVAACFRRPRSLVGLVKVTAAVAKESGESRPGEIVDDPLVGDHASMNTAIARTAASLAARGLLHQHDGGFYGLSFEARRVLSAYLRDDLDHALSIHDRIADYYCSELFEHSKDPRAFFEYGFHRITAADLAMRRHGDWARLQHLDWLTATVEREADALYALGQAARLLTLTERMKMDLCSGPSTTAERRSALTERIMEVEATIHRRATDYDHCRGVHEDLMRMRLGMPSPWLRNESSWQAVFKSGDSSVRLELAMRYLEIGSAESARGWLSPGADHESLTLLERARDLALAADDGGARPGHLQQEARMIAVRTLRALIQHETRTAAPWEWPSQSARGSAPDTRRRAEVADAKSHYSHAILILRGLRPTRRVRSLHCSVRCSYARNLYLRGRFGRANMELNRAHAFAARATGPEGHDALAEYHLHRAEYCLFRAQQKDAGEPMTRWLHRAARTALQGSHDSLQRGERSAVRWLWYYLLTAWSHRDGLKCELRSGETGESRDPARAEQLLLDGLRAVSGALLNANEGTKAEAAAWGLWSDLRDLFWSAEDLLKKAPGSTTKVSRGLVLGPQERHWNGLLERAGLRAAVAEREARHVPPPNSSIRVRESDFPLENINEFGLCAPSAPEEFDAEATLLLGNDVLPLKVRLRSRRPGAFAITSMDCSGRAILKTVVARQQIIPRDRGQRGRPQA